MSSTIHNNINGFHPTVESLEQALRIMVERNIELQTMLQSRKTGISYDTDDRIFRDRIRKLLVSLRETIEEAESCHRLDKVVSSPRLSSSSSDSVSNCNMYKFMDDFHELLLEFLKEVQHQPQDRIEHKQEKTDDFIGRKDVVWFVQELVMRFDQLANYYRLERQATPTWTIRILDLVNAMEKNISFEKTSIDEVDRCFGIRADLDQYQYMQKVITEKEVYISTLEGIIVCLQEQAMRRDSNRFCEIDLPQKPKENMASDHSQQLLFKTLQCVLAEKDEELVFLRKQSLLNARNPSPQLYDSSTQADDDGENVASEDLTEKHDIIYLHREIQSLKMQKLELEKERERILEEKRIQDRRQQVQEEATKTKLVYLQHMVRDLEAKIHQNPPVSSSPCHELGLLKTPLKSHDHRSQASLLSPNPKFFSFTKLSTRPSDMSPYSNS